MHSADDAAGGQIASGTKVACKLEEAGTSEEHAAFDTPVVESLPPGRSRSLSSDARQRGVSPPVARPPSPSERSPLAARRSISPQERPCLASPIVGRPLSPNERSPLVARRSISPTERPCWQTSVTIELPASHCLGRALERPAGLSIGNSPIQATRLCSSPSAFLAPRTGTPGLAFRPEPDQSSAGPAIVAASVPTPVASPSLSPPQPPKCAASVHLRVETTILQTPTLVSRELPPRSAGSVRVRTRVLSPVVSRGGTCSLPVGPQGGGTCSVPAGPQGGSTCALPVGPHGGSTCPLASIVDLSKAQSSEAASVGVPPPSSPPVAMRVVARPSSTLGSSANGFHVRQRVASPEHQALETQERERFVSPNTQGAKRSRSAGPMSQGAHRSRSAEVAPRPVHPAGHGTVPNLSRSTSPPALVKIRRPQQTGESSASSPLWQFTSQQGVPLERLDEDTVQRQTSSSLAALARMEIKKGVAQAQFDSELDDGDMSLDPASASPVIESNPSELDTTRGSVAVALARPSGNAAIAVPNKGTQIKYIPNAIKYMPTEFVMHEAPLASASTTAADDTEQIPMEPSTSSVNHGRAGSEQEAGASRKPGKGVVIIDKPSKEPEGSASKDHEGSVNGTPCSRASGAALIRKLSQILDDDDVDTSSDSGSPPPPKNRSKSPPKTGKSRSKSPTRKSPTRQSSGNSLSSLPEKDTDIDIETVVDVENAPPVCTASFGRALFAAAMSATVTAKQARHPQRARVGRLLLQHSQPALGNGLAKDVDADLVKRLFFDSMPERLVRIESIEQVISPKLLKRFLKVVAEEIGAVEATFHGTKPDLAEKIVSTGLSTGICQTGAYGLGAYVGTHAGVAHQYADADEAGRRYMCLVLVVAGKKVVKGQQGEQPKATALDNLSNPTQYCFVDEERLLVSHLITYHAKMGTRKRIGGGWHDPFQTKLSGAVRRAAQRSRKHGSR
mmetsp:Transcript_149373/g.271929  ORF Transcript_149373/g.271929 Transcript_149373/m.271929 type:complete len:961 (+) Transcript_149373:97-2979(+)